MRWLSQCNADVETSYFFTATFAENITNYDEALIAWKRFRRLLIKEYPYVRYIAVPEIQSRRGVWHFHALLVGLPTLATFRRRFGTRTNQEGKKTDAWMFEFTRMWNQANGAETDKTNRANIQKARSLGGICGYLVKYLAKDVGGLVPAGRRNYYAGGKGLQRPKVIITKKSLPDFGKMVYSVDYKGRFGENAQFQRYVHE